MPLGQASANYSSVVEFANIIATLHKSESSNQSQSPTLGSSPRPSTPLSVTMTSTLNDLVPWFYGRDASDEGGQQDPAEFIENLTFAIDGQTYTDEARKQTATRVIFRTRLRNKALIWYQGLAAEVRDNLESLEAAFLTRFALVPRKEVDQIRFLDLVLNLRQRGRSIVEYTREGNQLNGECPEKFRDVLGHQFIAGLDDKGKVDLVQVYLGAHKSTVSYADAK